MSIEKIISELRKIYSAFNAEYFDNDLKEPIIIIQTNGRKKDVMGWCTVHEIWNNLDTKEKEYEITICAEFLNRPLYEIGATVLHEMVHLDNIKKGIEDVNKDGRCHNKKFKEAAESKGLIIEKAPKIGWSVSTLNLASKKIMDSLKLNESLFSWQRETLESSRPRPELHKYKCPSCGTKISNRKELEIKCLKCNVNFEEV